MSKHLLTIPKSSKHKHRLDRSPISTAAGIAIAVILLVLALLAILS